MRALIVYESMFGNTRDVANAVAEGLGEHAEADVVEVGEAPNQPGPDVDLLVVGGPTHAFGMTRRKTREDAAKQTTSLVSHGDGLREWLAALPRTDRNLAAAAFDTRVRIRGLPGSAARGAARRLRRCGYRLVASSQSYYVAETVGPLTDGELDRARTWGRGLGQSMEVEANGGG